MVVRLPGTSKEIPRKAPTVLSRATPSDERVFVVIGGGAAGWTACYTLRASGYTGHIRLISCEEHLPYDRTVLSKYVGMAESSIVRKLALRPESFYEEHDVLAYVHAAGLLLLGPAPVFIFLSSLLLLFLLMFCFEVRLTGARGCCSYLGHGSRVVSVDSVTRTVRTLNGGVIHYDKLLCCSGGRPRTLQPSQQPTGNTDTATSAVSSSPVSTSDDAVPGAHLDNIFTMHNAADAARLGTCVKRVVLAARQHDRVRTPLYVAWRCIVGSLCSR